MRIKQILSLAVAFALIFSFSGCMRRNENDQNQQNETNNTVEDELVIYHNNTELAPMLISLAEEYSAATGKKISAQLAGNDFFGEVKSKNAAIYIVDTHSDLSEWHSGGFFADLMNDTGLSSLVSGIPSGLQFNSSGLGNYGVPLMLEGYGYIFDREMLDDLFGGENTEALVNDLRTCSFTEFEGFVAAVDTYIAAPSAATVTLNGRNYTFAAEKTGKAANLTGVFSLNNESTRAMEHLLSYVLAAKFGSRYEVMTADETAVTGMNDILSAYIEVLDLHTGHIAGAEGSISRGEEFTGGDYNYSTSIDLFTRGYALFYPGGTSDTADFEESSAGFGANLDIIPMKLPITDEQITASGMTAEKLRNSIVIGSRYYIAVNPNASETLSAAAREFIDWIYNDEAGRTAYSSAFGGVPFNFEYTANENGTVNGENGNSSAAEGYGNETENGTVSPENAEPSGTAQNGNTTAGENSGAVNENSGTAAENGTAAEENHTAAENRIPSQNVSGTLLSAVADYYAAGNWIPDMTAAMPADFVDEVLGKGTRDYWGMETWTAEDRTGFVETILGGWKERLDRSNTAVG